MSHKYCTVTIRVSGLRQNHWGIIVGLLAISAIVINTKSHIMGSSGKDVDKLSPKNQTWIEQGMKKSIIQKAVFQLKNSKAINKSPKGTAKKMRLPKPANKAAQTISKLMPAMCMLRC